jgi:biopolymer transport protein ExbB/TolQ
VLALVLSVAFFAVVSQFPDRWVGQTFTNRGWIPYATVSFSIWALMILFVKGRKVALQKKALQHTIVPDEPDFVLSTETVHRVMDRLYEVSDDPRHFILLNRIQLGLANLKNMGQIGDVDGVLRSQAENDEAAMESSYTVLKGLIWAIPILGFIGTALGLSQAMGAFTKVLNQTSDMETLKNSLKEVTAGLSISFETTLHALIGALVIQLLLTMLKRREEQMLDDFMEYCQRHVVNRLRIRRDAVGVEEADGTPVAI